MFMFSKRVSNRVARPTRTTLHGHEHLNTGQTPFRFGGVPLQLQTTSPPARPRPLPRLNHGPRSPAPPQSANRLSSLAKLFGRHDCFLRLFCGAFATPRLELA